MTAAVVDGFGVVVVVVYCVVNDAVVVVVVVVVVAGNVVGVWANYLDVVVVERENGPVNDSY